MNKIKLIATLVGIMWFGSNVSAQEIWDGEMMTFTKMDNSDWTQDSSQDRITDSVWITRADKKGIFNIKKETAYDSASPSGTEWAYGTTADTAALTFDTWVKTHGNNPSSMINKDMVLHLIAEDIYIDLKFTSFTGGGAGGGFTYERSTEPKVSVTNLQPKPSINLYPIPATKTIQVSGLELESAYVIVNAVGAVVSNGELASRGSINISSLENGVYFLQLEEGTTRRFIKE